MGTGQAPLGLEGSKGHALSGVRVLKFDGAIAPKVLRFDAPLIYRWRPLIIKP